MAATASSSTSMASSSSKHAMFDVFLSFRGEDTRDSFTDHLYAALNRASISTFRDNDAIKRGQDLEPELVKAIQESKASIVVISENYAKSRWCLDELVLILDQRRKFNRFVLPVFYHVDPSDVRNQRQSFAIEGTKWTEVKENQWKAALNEVANLTGLAVSGSETDFITKIVRIIDSELDLKLVSTPAHLTGMESRTKYVNSWLKNENSDFQILAICGMGGIGKTTLAKSIYNSHKRNFEGSSFLEEIGKHNEQSYGLLSLQKQLVTDILGETAERIPGVSEGTYKIEKALQLKRVLIVLDDIDDKDEISTLLGTKAFHTQSKIIITTRLLDVNAWFGSLSWRCHMHEVELLNDDESLKLLSWHAFGSNIPMGGFEDLAVELARYCGGNPLALKVLGSSLFVSAEDSEKGNLNSMIDIWRSKLTFLNSQKGDLYSNIQRILQKSFDSLPYSSYKELFLHIAVFFVGEDEDYTVNILEHDWHAKAGIKTLINRCLLTISHSKKLMMHQLLQDMGKNIVREESKDTAKHTRVWFSDEVYRLLTKGYGSETIEGLALDARKLKKGTKVLTIKTSSLARMDNLKLLQLKFVRLSGSYKNIPGLRWLCWHGCHLETIPSGLLMNSLVAIDMSYGILKKLEPPTVLASLKILNLKSCHNLVSVYNLHRTPNLETLILWDCKNLIHLSKAVGDLRSLTLLNLASCKNLWKFSSNISKAVCIGGGLPEQPLFSLPPSLKFLFLNYCNLENNSDLHVVFNCQSLFGMNLSFNLFEFLPNKININMLRVLNLSYCKNLKSLLCLPGTLEELYTDYCTSLEKITFQSARYRLRRIGYLGCSKLSEIQRLFKLVSIKKLDDAHMGNMKWIKAYEDFKVDLVGSIMTGGRIWHTQMLYEYGIRSVYLQGIQDQSMTSEYMSSSSSLSFCVPLCPKQRKIQNLNITSLYRSLGEKEDTLVLLAKISNATKGLTWIYDPWLYCKPRVDEDVVSLSEWPIGNILDAGDAVNVNIIVGNGLVVSRCGASLVYMDDAEVKQDNFENYSKEEEVIGGDLSGLQLKSGEYMLSRRDFSDSVTTDWFKLITDHTVHYKDLQQQVITYYSYPSEESFMKLRSPLELHRDTLNKNIWLGYFDSESEICKIQKMVSSLVGVEYLYYYKESKELNVSGLIDCIDVETCVRHFEKKATITDVGYNVKRLLKRRRVIAVWDTSKHCTWFYPYDYMYIWTSKKKFY